MTAAPSHSLATVRARVRQSAQAATSEGLQRLTFQAMSTVCRVNVAGGEARRVRAFQEQVLDWVAAFEAQYSRFLPDSLISRINAAAGEHWVEVDPETDALLQLCHEMVFFTRGVFDPTALPLLRLWNWKAAQPTIPGENDLATARELVGWSKIQRRRGGVFLPRAGMCLDLGGIGKEYAVDRVMQIAGQHGLEHVLVDFGQDVRVQGQPPGRGPWRIGLEDPKHPGTCWASAAVNQHAVATSGDYLRHFTTAGRRYGHIIDPRNGQPVHNGCLAVSIIAPTCTLAGILSTAAFILGMEAGLDLIRLCPGVEGVIVGETSRATTPQFQLYVQPQN